MAHRDKHVTASSTATTTSFYPSNKSTHVKKVKNNSRHQTQTQFQHQNRNQHHQPQPQPQPPPQPQSQPLSQPQSLPQRLQPQPQYELDEPSYDTSSTLEERIKVDRRQLEFLLCAPKFVDKSNTHLFDQIAKRHGVTTITADRNFKIGATSKKPPTLRIIAPIGCEAKIQSAIADLHRFLDTKSGRITARLEMPKDQHFFVIGRKGENIKEVMRQTGCRVHFPDASTYKYKGGATRDQVTVVGTVEDVEVARKELRSLMPITISFDVPSAVPDSSITMSEDVTGLAKEWGVTIYFKQRVQKRPLALIKGTRGRASFVETAALELLQLWLPNAPMDGYTLQIDVPSTLHGPVIGTGGSNIKKLMDLTQTKIRFPDASQFSSLFISGSVIQTKVVYMFLQGVTPYVISLDLEDDDTSLLSHHAHTMHLEIEEFLKTVIESKFAVTVNIKSKTATSVTIFIKTVESMAASAYLARTEILIVLGKTYELGAEKLDLGNPEINSVIDDPKFVQEGMPNIVHELHLEMGTAFSGFTPKIGLDLDQLDFAHHISGDVSSLNLRDPPHAVLEQPPHSLLQGPVHVVTTLSPMHDPGNWVNQNQNQSQVVNLPEFLPNVSVMQSTQQHQHQQHRQQHQHQQHRQQQHHQRQQHDVNSNVLHQHDHKQQQHHQQQQYGQHQHHHPHHSHLHQQQQQQHQRQHHHQQHHHHHPSNGITMTTIAGPHLFNGITNSTATTNTNDTNNINNINNTNTNNSINTDNNINADTIDTTNNMVLSREALQLNDIIETPALLLSPKASEKMIVNADVLVGVDQFLGNTHIDNTHHIVVNNNDADDEDDDDGDDEVAADDDVGGNSADEFYGDDKYDDDVDDTTSHRRHKTASLTSSLNLRSGISSASPTLDAAKEEEDKRRLMAKSAIGNPDYTQMRTPTSFWSGGFLSQSMPEIPSNKAGFSAFMESMREGTGFDESDPLSTSLSTSRGSEGFGEVGVTATPPDSRTEDEKLSDYWNVATVSQLLTKLNLASYVELFRTQEIDLPTLLMLTSEDLQEIGITAFGARKKLLLAICDLKKMRSTDSNFLASILDLDSNNVSPSPEALKSKRASSTPNAAQDPVISQLKQLHRRQSHSAPTTPIGSPIRPHRSGSSQTSNITSSVMGWQPTQETQDH